MWLVSSESKNKKMSPTYHRQYPKCTFAQMVVHQKFRLFPHVATAFPPTYQQSCAQLACCLRWPPSQRLANKFFDVSTNVHQSSSKVHHQAMNVKRNKDAPYKVTLNWIIWSTYCKYVHTYIYLYRWIHIKKSFFVCVNVVEKNVLFQVKLKIHIQNYLYLCWVTQHNVILKKDQRTKSLKFIFPTIL